MDSRGLMTKNLRKDVLKKGNNYLFLIGIDEYCDPQIHDLNNAVKDAKDIRETLLKDYNFEKKYLFELYNSLATRRNIYEEFKRLRDKIKPEEDNLLIYFAGHGKYEKTVDIGYWIPSDAKFDSEDTYIENSSIINSFIRTINTKHTLLISDSCFSGSIFTKGSNRSIGFSPLEELYKRKSRWALCSGREDELVSDGNADGNSPFASSLLEILKSNDQPKLNISKIANDVREATASQSNQLPDGRVLFNVGDKGGQFVFKKKILKESSSHSEIKDNELKLWHEANYLYTYASFLNYIENYPGGKFVKKAVSSIRALIEETEFHDGRNYHTPEPTPPADELDRLVLEFLIQFNKWYFSPLKIKKFGGRQSGFELFNTFETTKEITDSLRKLLNEGRVKKKLSKKGNPIYKIN